MTGMQVQSYVRISPTPPLSRVADDNQWATSYVPLTCRADPCCALSPLDSVPLDAFDHWAAGVHGGYVHGVVGDVHVVEHERVALFGPIRDVALGARRERALCRLAHLRVQPAVGVGKRRLAALLRRCATGSGGSGGAGDGWAEAGRRRVQEGGRGLCSAGGWARSAGDEVGGEIKSRPAQLGGLCNDLCLSGESLLSVAVVSDCRCTRATTAPWQPRMLVSALRGTLGCQEPRMGCRLRAGSCHEGVGKGKAPLVAARCARH